MKNSRAKECSTDFSTMVFSIIYSFNDPDDQLAVPNK